MIDISGLAQKGINTAFRVFKDILVSSEIVVKANSYNPVTGGFTDSETLYPVSEIICCGYDSSRIDGDIIRDKDKEAVLKVSEVPVEITNEMKIRFTGGGEWDILHVEIDPSSTVYFLQLRRP